MTSPSRPLRLAALLVAASAALSACSGGDSEPAGEAGSATTSALPTPSTTIAVPSGLEITPPGTSLAFGEPATVAHEAGKQGTVLGLRVDSAEQGSLEDFRGFDLDDPYKKRGNYYYVRVTVTNKGPSPVSELPVPLWGVSGDNRLLQAVEFRSAFKKCPTEYLPKGFKKGDRFRTCLVYLSPNHGKLAGVSYRPTEEYVQIEWQGKVKMLAEPKKKDKKKGS